MSINPAHLPVTLDVDTIRKTVLTNIIKMLTARQWLNKDNLEQNILHITNINSDDNVYKIKMDNKPNDNITSTIAIKLLPQKVTSITKSPIITEFISNNKDNYKFLIVDSISDKIQQIITTDNMEIFMEKFFMINLIEHICSPQYEVLSKEESEEMQRVYQVKKSQLKKMFDSDPVSKYFNLKRGQIVRIIRNSEITCKTVDYRIVIHKTVDKT